MAKSCGAPQPRADRFSYPLSFIVVNIDLNGPFLCCRAVVPHMVKAGYGRIVMTVPER